MFKKIHNCRKMKRTNTSFLITLAFITYSFTACTQARPIKLKELLVVGYQTDDSLKKRHMTMEFVYKISGNGHYEYHSNYFNGINFTGSTRDTSYTLPDSVINVINRIITNQGIFKSHVKDYRLSGNDSYLGPIMYIYYSTVNGYKDSIITIYPYMDEILKNSLKKVYALPSPDRIRTGKIYHDSILEHIIMAQDINRLNHPQGTNSPHIKDLKSGN